MITKKFYNSKYLKQILNSQNHGRRFSYIVRNIVGDVKDKIILDVGCGSGVKVEYLTKNNAVYGLDISKKAVEFARRRGIKAEVCEVEQGIPFKNKKFDIVICDNVLEHLFYPKGVLSEIKRVLKDEGIFIVAIPNHFSLDKRIRILLGRSIDESTDYFNNEFHEWDYPHIRFFTFKGFVKLLKLTNFMVIKAVPFSVIPPWKLGFIMRKFAKFFPGIFCTSFYIKCKKENKK